MKTRILWLAGLAMIVSAACVLLEYTSTPEPTTPIITPIRTRPPSLEITLTSIPGSGAGDTWVRPKDSMVMVFVPQGEFVMGVDANAAMDFCHQFMNYCEPDWFTAEAPVHSVYLRAYWIDRTEVTNDQYALCVADKACSLPEHFAVIAPVEYYYDGRHGNYPVMYVSWYDAEAYCAWAESRLPTEAEWEKAARGTDGRMFPWGDTPPDADQVCYYAIDNLAGVGNCPAGASPYGALDMAGSVWEWVADWFDAGYYSLSPLENPVGPTTGTVRAIRGGSALNTDFELRSTSRFGNDPGNADVGIGFRCVRDATTP
jgi:formylglycine-generating enzyme required for sulfatase activity